MMARPESPSPAGDSLLATIDQPVSKRDKRRIQLLDRLKDMTTVFGQNIRQHYDAQAHALQVDIALILQTKPYENRALDEDPAVLKSHVEKIAEQHKVPAQALESADFTHEAGRRYAEFVREVNTAVEQKDTNLTLLAANYQRNREDLNLRHAFHTRLAQEEHDFLAATLRQRLMNQISKKKEKLLKEKEQLDIGDSNAALLHPSHFSLTNPASPGGSHKRATRNTGRRGDPDDWATFDKKKRKPLFEDIEGSPAPSGRYDTGSNGHWSNLKSRAAYNQFEAPVYSFNELFTDNELNMAINNSAVAATNYLIRKVNGEANGNGFHRQHGSGAHSSVEMDVENSSTPVPIEMERTVSQSYHQTRGVTRNALTESAAVALRDNPTGMALPTIIPAVRGQRGAGAPSMTNPLTQAEIDADMAIYMAESEDVAMLDAALALTKPMEYQYRAPLHQADSQEGFSSSIPALGGVPMSAQSSMAGFSEGGAPMSRQASVIGGPGGIGMKRTVSGTGSLLGDGRRVRSRMQ